MKINLFGGQIAAQTATLQRTAPYTQLVIDGVLGVGAAAIVEIFSTTVDYGTCLVILENVSAAAQNIRVGFAPGPSFGPAVIGFLLPPPPSVLSRIIIPNFTPAPGLSFSAIADGAGALLNRFIVMAPK